MSTDNGHMAQIINCTFKSSVECARNCGYVQHFIGRCQEALIEKLQMHCITAKFIPQLLNQDRRDNHIAICQELLDPADEDKTLVKRIISGDETRVYGYDAEMKAYTSEWVGKSSLRL